MKYMGHPKDDECSICFAIHCGCDVEMQRAVRKIRDENQKFRKGYFFSPNGRQLVWSLRGPPIKPTLTVEMYSKWYTLWLVMPDSEVRQVLYPRCNKYDDIVSWRDHVPNPAAVERMAEENGYEIEELALELMVGRWIIEGRGTYVRAS